MGRYALILLLSVLSIVDSYGQSCSDCVFGIPILPAPETVGIPTVIQIDKTGFRGNCLGTTIDPQWTLNGGDIIGPSDRDSVVISVSGPFELVMEYNWLGGMEFSTEACPVTNCQTPDSLLALSTSETTASLAWSEVEGANQYAIVYKITGDEYIGTLSMINSVDLEGLRCESAYQWQVASFCDGIFGGFSETGSFNTGACTITCTVPANLAAVNVGENYAELTWDSIPGSNRYKVRYRMPGMAWANRETFDNVYRIEDLQCQSTYEWQVQQVCHQTISLWSGTLQLNTGACTIFCDRPEDPTTISTGISEANLTWTGPADVQSYDVRYRIPGRSWTNLSAMESAIQVAGLFCGTNYEWQVRSVCEDLNSEWSARVEFITEECQFDCGDPSNLGQSEITESSATLKWSGLTEASYYEVRFRSAQENWSYINVIDTFRTIDVFNCSTLYEWQVRSICGQVPGDWVGSGESGTESCALAVGVPVAENPDFEVECGLDIILVLDESGSIDAGEEQFVRDALIDFVQALKGTGSNLSIVEFASTARAEILDSCSISGSPHYVEITAGSIESCLQPYINLDYGSAEIGENTNWDDALLKVQDVISSNDIQPDIVLFFTDGNPTIYIDEFNNDSLSSFGVNSGALTHAMKQANKVKETTHMFIVGVGNGINIENIKMISGLDLNNGDISIADYEVAPDFEDLSECFNNIALIACGTEAELSLTGPECLIDDSLEVVFHIEISNEGGESALEVQLMAELPDSYTYLGSSRDPEIGMVSRVGNTLTWRMGDYELESGQNAIWSITSTKPDGSLPDTAYASANGINLTNTPLSDFWVISQAVFSPTNTLFISYGLAEDSTICLPWLPDLAGPIESVDFCNTVDLSVYELEYTDTEICLEVQRNSDGSNMDTLCLVACDRSICQACDTIVLVIDIDSLSQESGSCLTPNVITPNGDGMNDQFYISCEDHGVGLQFMVFNRWGNMVYKNEDYQNDWAGTYHGDPLPEGIYYYTLKYRTESGRDVYIGRDLTILR